MANVFLGINPVYQLLQMQPEESAELSWPEEKKMRPSESLPTKLK